VDRYRVSLAGKALSDSAPDPLRATGNEGGFSHEMPLEM
jgi:hypothetical protein